MEAEADLRRAGAEPALPWSLAWSLAWPLESLLGLPRRLPLTSACPVVVVAVAVAVAAAAALLLAFESPPAPFPAPSPLLGVRPPLACARDGSCTVDLLGIRWARPRVGFAPAVSACWAITAWPVPPLLGLAFDPLVVAVALSARPLGLEWWAAFAAVVTDMAPGVTVECFAPPGREPFPSDSWDLGVTVMCTVGTVGTRMRSAASRTDMMARHGTASHGRQHR